MKKPFVVSGDFVSKCKKAAEETNEIVQSIKPNNEDSVRLNGILKDAAINFGDLLCEWCEISREYIRELNEGEQNEN